MMWAKNQSSKPRKSPLRTQPMKGACRKCTGSFSPAQMCSPTILSVCECLATKSWRSFEGRHYNSRNTLKTRVKSHSNTVRSFRSYKKILNSKTTLRKKKICWSKISMSSLLNITKRTKHCDLQKDMLRPTTVHTLKGGKGSATPLSKWRSREKSNTTKNRKIFGPSSNDWFVVGVVII